VNTVKICQLALVVLLSAVPAFLAVAWTPLPVHWDDGMYSVRTMDWAEIVYQRGVVRGVGRGLIYDLPGQYLPAVFITSLPAAITCGTARAMMFCQVFWLIVSQASIYGIVRRLCSHGWALIAIFWATTITAYVYWSGQVLGEPSLFGTLSLLLFLLVAWAECFEWKKSIFVGVVLGIGVLTKQHFAVLGAAPVLLFLIWRWFRFRGPGASFKDQLTQFMLLVLTPLLVAGPWYYFHYREVLAYVFQPAFLPHAIGESGRLEKLLAYGRVVCSDTGIPFIATCVTGIVWGIANQFVSCSSSADRWKRFAPLLFVSSGAIGFYAAGSLGNSNPRFAAPAELILGILACVSLANLWPILPRWGRVMALIPFVLHCIIGPAQLVGASLPQFITGVKLSGIYSPKDLTETVRVVETLRGRYEPSSNVWIVGSADELNSPLVDVMLREKGIKASIASLYGWDESEITLDDIIARIKGGDFLLCDRKAPTSSVLMTKWDRGLIETFQNGHEYNAISDGGNGGATEPRFLLFQKQRMTSSNSSPKP
jgi:hypothetical protein